jgi:hypothetical protein
MFVGADKHTLPIVKIMSWFSTNQLYGWTVSGVFYMSGLGNWDNRGEIYNRCSIHLMKDIMDATG